jgi:hypothetical protein
MKTYKYKENAAGFDNAFFELYSECRDTCLWFWKKSVVPFSIDDNKEALRQIEKSGSLSQFVRARELSKWL